MNDVLEKNADASFTESLSLGDKDEALKLVGLERVGSFTEEQYRRVRLKLVRLNLSVFGSTCLSYRRIGPSHTPALCGGLLLAISVGLPP